MPRLLKQPSPERANDERERKVRDLLREEQNREGMLNMIAGSVYLKRCFGRAV